MASASTNGFHQNGDKRQKLSDGIDEETMNSGAEGYVQFGVVFGHCAELWRWTRC